METYKKNLSNHYKDVKHNIEQYSKEFHNNYIFIMSNLFSTSLIIFIFYKKQANCLFFTSYIVYKPIFIFTSKQTIVHDL